MKSYLKETAVFKKLQEMKKRTSGLSNGDNDLVGFPEMISHIEG